MNEWINEWMNEWKVYSLKLDNFYEWEQCFNVWVVTDCIKWMNGHINSAMLNKLDLFG